MEIRFRAWDPKNKELLYKFGDCLFGVEPNGEFSLGRMMEYGTHEETIPLDVDLWSGIIDMNGVYVYHNDIVDISMVDEPRVVQFTPYGWGIFPEYIPRDLWELAERGRLTVVGNKHLHHICPDCGWNVTSVNNHVCNMCRESVQRQLNK